MHYPGGKRQTCRLTFNMESLTAIFLALGDSWLWIRTSPGIRTFPWSYRKHFPELDHSSPFITLRGLDPVLLLVLTDCPVVYFCCHQPNLSFSRKTYVFPSRIRPMITQG